MFQAKSKRVPTAADGAAIISCDVFDTLLHRDHRSERHRQRNIAAVAAAQLIISLQVLREPAVIDRVRREVQREAYRVQDMTRPSGDVSFADMVDAMARLLALDAAGARILHEAELAVELSQLRPNRPLFDWLAAQAVGGRRIIAISDTYHSAATITGLLDALEPGHSIATVYTSADYDATKRSGALFTAVLRAEQARPSSMLHLGDDLLADVAMPRAAGIATRHLVRPTGLRFWRKMDALAARALGVLRAPGLPPAVATGWRM